MSELSALDEGLAEASRLVDGGEEGSALQLLLELELEHPEDATLLCMLGAVSAEIGAEGMAVDYFKRCLAQGPTDPAILVTLGAGLSAAADPAAEPALRLAAITAPDLPAARMHYGSHLVRNGLLEEGLEELQAALRLDPEESIIRRELGVAYLLSGRDAAALAEFEAAVSLAPDDADSRLLFGLALVQSGDLLRAAEELHPAAAGLAQDGESQLLLALVFSIAGWEDEAWLALSRAETADHPLDSALIREVEEALSVGEDAVRSLLVDELAPSLLRDRMFQG